MLDRRTPRGWTYSRVGLNGELIKHETFLEVRLRPRLVKTPNGAIMINNGMVASGASSRASSRTIPFPSRRTIEMTKEIFGCRFVFVIIACGMTLTAPCAVARDRSTKASQDRGMQASHSIVVIDAGHGGFDRGGIPGQRVAEKDIALDVALRLRQKLQAAGYVVVMTRDTDVFVPLPSRVAIANSYRNAIFISSILFPRHEAAPMESRPTIIDATAPLSLPIFIEM